MLSNYKTLNVSSIRKQYDLFFERIMVLYNLTFSKKENDHGVENVKRFIIELYEAGRISDYTKNTIDELITNFTLLLSGQIKKRAVDLDYLDANISLVISDINASIGELIHWFISSYNGSFYLVNRTSIPVYADACIVLIIEFWHNKKPSYVLI